MKRKYTLGAVVAFALAAPAIVAPQLVSAQAQDDTMAMPMPPADAQAAEYPDVPIGHWAYAAIDKLSRAGIVEGLPSGAYAGNKPMTRYEFAVAIARLLDRIPNGSGNGVPGPQGEKGEKGDPGTPGVNGTAGGAGTGTPTDLTNYYTIPQTDAKFATKAELQDAINSLTREFRTELANLGVRVDALENRMSMVERRVAAPARTTFTPSLLHRTGYFSAISSNNLVNSDGSQGLPGRDIFLGNTTNANRPGLPTNANDSGSEIADKKFSYTDFELRITDRTTDRLSLNAALRSLSGTAEDPWAGEDLVNSGNIHVREAYAVADLSNRKFLGASGLTVSLGRQQTKIAQGLLYDNQLSPTDQINSMFNLGPLKFNLFTGSTNNNRTGLGDPYLNTGAVQWMGANSADITFGNGGYPGTGGVAFANNGNINALLSGAIVGFDNNLQNPNGGVGIPGVGPNLATGLSDDNEGAIRGAVNLFRIAGQPVALGYTRLFDGVNQEKGDSFDLTIPLFNRTVGIEYVRKDQYFNGLDADNASAYNITVPVLRTRILDLNAAYGKADNDFEFFAASSANPYARTYAEALFDRPMALGSPMINGGSAGGPNGPAYMAAKQVYDFTGTLRIPIAFLRRIPLDFRYYAANGTDRAGGGDTSLGHVWSVGSTFSVTPGVDLEVKYGEYEPSGNFEKLNYFRVGANVGF